MQKFTILAGDDTLQNSRTLLNDSLSTIRSQNSGTTFPTQDLYVGMGFWKTDTEELYALASVDPSVWTKLVTSATDSETLSGRLDNLENSTGPLASTIVKGFVELATQTEVNTGTDTSRAVTPSTLKNLLDATVATQPTLSSPNKTSFSAKTVVPGGNWDYSYTFTLMRNDARSFENHSHVDATSITPYSTTSTFSIGGGGNNYAAVMAAHDDNNPRTGRLKNFDYFTVNYDGVTPNNTTVTVQGSVKVHDVGSYTNNDNGWSFVANNVEVEAMEVSNQKGTARLYVLLYWSGAELKMRLRFNGPSTGHGDNRNGFAVNINRSRVDL